MNFEDEKLLGFVSENLHKVWQKPLRNVRIIQNYGLIARGTRSIVVMCNNEPSVIGSNVI